MILSMNYSLFLRISMEKCGVTGFCEKIHRYRAHRESDTEKFHDAITEIDSEDARDNRFVLTFSGTVAGIMTAAFKQSA